MQYLFKNMKKLLSEIHNLFFTIDLVLYFKK